MRGNTIFGMSPYVLVKDWGERLPCVEPCRDDLSLSNSTAKHGDDETIVCMRFQELHGRM